MAENTLQFQWIVTIQGNLDAMFHDDPNVFVAGDHLIYPIEQNIVVRAAPDAYVAFGRPKGHRGSYAVCEEDGIFPQVVFEVWSPGNRAKQMAEKRDFYEKYGAEEYYIIYPDSPARVEGWLRKDGRLVPIEEMNGYVSPRLKVKFEFDRGHLALYRPNGERFLSFVEINEAAEEARRQAATELHHAREARLRAEAEKRRADEESRKALAEQKRADEERLRAEAEQKRADEERLRAEAEQKRADEERLRAEAEQKRADEESRKALAEQKRADEESRKALAEQKRAEEERLRAEAEQKRANEERLRAEAEQKRADEERLRAKAEQKRADEERLRAEAERKRALSAEQRAARLATKLRELGIDSGDE